MKLFSPPQEKFLYFRKQKNRKKIINFSKESFSYISENFFIFQEAETLKNFYVSGSNFPSSSNVSYILGNRTF